MRLYPKRIFSPVLVDWFSIIMLSFGTHNSIALDAKTSASVVFEKYVLSFVSLHIHPENRILFPNHSLNSSTALSTTRISWEPSTKIISLFSTVWFKRLYSHSFFQRLMISGVSIYNLCIRVFLGRISDTFFSIHLDLIPSLSSIFPSSFDSRNNTLMFCYIEFIIYSFYYKECEKCRGDNTKDNSKSHSRPELISQGYRQYSEYGCNRCENHWFESRRSCFDESNKTIHSLF